MPDNKTRLTQEGHRSRLGRDVAGTQPDANELYKVGDKVGGRYEVSAIHYGAMGVVYGCFDHQTKLPRALKTVRARHVGDKQVLSLFESEASVWIALEKHPYIVRAYLVERFKSLPYVITEYVRGPEGMEGDLRGWLGHPRLTLPVAVAMALQIAQGMQHAVRKVPTLVHRDLKPGNILVNGDGKAMVTDFGLVQAAQSDAGTPAYMSPEQWRAEAIDARSDIYAYGCVLFEMFTAHRLFSAVTESEWEFAHLKKSPATLTGINPSLPTEIDLFVRRCLEKDTGARPRNWDEIVSFFAEWYHRVTGNAVILDFSVFELDVAEWLSASYSLLNLKCYEEALLACNRVLVSDINNAGAWNNKGCALRNLKRYAEAIQAFDRTLTINLGDAFAWANKGDTLRDMRHFEEAIQAYEKAIAVDKNLAPAWIGKGNVLRAISRNDDSLRAYDMALTIDPNDVFAWCNKGHTLHEMRYFDEAIQAYEKAITGDKNLAPAWIGKGNVLIDIGRNDEALQAYDMALMIDPNNSAAWSNRGAPLFRLKRFSEAIQSYDKSIAGDQTLASAWIGKGLTFFELNRNEEAIQAYDRALAIDPGLVAVWNNKGCALDKLSRFDEAVEAYEEVIARNSEDANAWLKKGSALLRLERYEDALAAFDHATPIDGNGGISFIRGFTLQKLERYSESISACDQALAINPSLAIAQSTKSRSLHELKRVEMLRPAPRTGSVWKRLWGK
ncbi:MAG: serine/threonine-protein kinase [Betaproteobacteria bacterium]